MQLIAFFLVFFGFFFNTSAEARWATREDLDVSIEFYNRDIYIYKDGSYQETIEFSNIPLKESGKDRLVSYPIVYNASNSTVKILEAKTIQGDREYPVDQKLIEDKPLASSPQGFDQNNQILIVFPKLNLESKIYLKYQIMVKEPAVPNFYSTNFVYGSEGYWQASKCHIVSQLPLYVQAHDKDQYLEVKQGKTGDKTEINIILKKPIIKIPTNEERSVINYNVYPWVNVSSLKEWSQLGSLLVKSYEAVLNQPLPILFKKIAEDANIENTLSEKINRITSQLAEKITYMGDWRTIKGKFVPRSLEEIASSRIGDCKDFSAATTAILRSLQIDAQVALVSRGMPDSAFPNDLPALSDFNHAIVYVGAHPKPYWIDPTNFTSFAGGIYPDIAGRKALVLNVKKSTLLKTNALDFKDASVSIIEKIELPNKLTDPTLVEGRIRLTGVEALSLTGADLQASKESIDHYILSLVTNPASTIQWKVAPYNLTSRVVQDLNFSYQFTEERTQMKTTSGSAFLLPMHGRIKGLLIKTNDRVSDLLLSLPAEYYYETVLPKATLIGKEFTECSISSPWIDGARKIIHTPTGIQIMDVLTVKKDRISNQDLKSMEYLQLQNNAFTCFGDTALVYKK